MWQYRLSGARVAEGRGDLPTAIERYRALYDQDHDKVSESEQPNGVPIRREYAGVLLKAGAANPRYYDEAKKVLDTAPPDDIDARKMLVAAYLLKGRSIAAAGDAGGRKEESRASTRGPRRRPTPWPSTRPPAGTRSCRPRPSG